jgi:malonyl-CoA O-methyltransferase
VSDPTVQAAYTQWAATYDTDRNLTRDLDQSATRALLAGRRARSALELGCGTGKNTALLAQIAGRVQALDFSEGMLAQARAKVQAPNVTFTAADLTRPWPCADGSVDLAVGNLVLEHIADLGPVFAEAARALEPGGTLLLSELHPFKQYLGSKAVFQNGQERVELTAFVHHISDFLGAAAEAGLRLVDLKEWWHAEDQQAPPRLLTLLFVK